MITLRKEQDKIQKCINQIHDDKLDGLIDKKMYLNKGKTKKFSQVEIAEQMALHEKAIKLLPDNQYGHELNRLCSKLFENSEVDKNVKLLNFLF